MLCPFCAEEINDAAIKCKHCHSMLGILNAQSNTLNVNIPQSIALDLDEQKLNVIKKAYLYLSGATGCAIVGGIIGSSSDAIIELFSGWVGWVLAMLIINGLPMAASFAKKHRELSVGILLLNGFMSGIVLAPMLTVVSYYFDGNSIIGQAIVTTILIFGMITFLVFVYGKKISFSKLLIPSLFGVLVIGTISYGIFGGGSGVDWLLNIGIGLLGSIMITKTTSELFHSAEEVHPIDAALELFAGVFNLFVSILRILSRLK